jgi:hypothetical protein
MFGATGQAEKEGLQAGLSVHGFQAMLWRYSVRTVDLMKIWEEVFKGQEDRIVRVIATQHVSAWAVNEILGYRDTANHVDALSTAPYFGYMALDDSRSKDRDLDSLFAFLETDIERTFESAAENKKLADKYGVRYITYEAGQHVVSHTDLASIEKLNRDPRMGALYTKYMDAWKRRFGDVMVLFNSTGGIGNHGAWGLQEYPGQPLDKAPKRKAVLEFLGQ